MDSIGSSNIDGIHHFDIGYQALWDKSDTFVVSKEFRLISQLTSEIKKLARDKRKNLYKYDKIRRLRAERASYVDNFENQLERKFNDQTTTLEPLEVNKCVDRVVATGMARIAEFVVGESQQFFDHYAAGKGTTPVYPADISLVDEIARVNIEEQGYATASGAVIKFGAYFGTNVQTATVTEGAVFDEMVNGDMLFRNVFPLNKVINHIQGTTFFTLSEAIYQSSL